MESSRRASARVGRMNQRYVDGARLLSCAVILRGTNSSCTDIKPEYQVLLITSSKHRNSWILPKGGWEADESVTESVVREADEEAGVLVRVAAELGTLPCNSAGKEPCCIYGFLCSIEKIYEKWAESGFRKRKWVDLHEAMEILNHRPELRTFLDRAHAFIKESSNVMIR